MYALNLEATHLLVLLYFLSYLFHLLNPRWPESVKALHGLPNRVNTPGIGYPESLIS